uniref:Uncharacterized protein n=1 Tax=Caulobacter sp. (strain K31) TaxID=366602 RepID=B0T9H7_CAUSK
MTRFTSFPHYPHHTRQTLRGRFARHLRHGDRAGLLSEDTTVSDATMLAVLRGAVFEPGLGHERFAETYRTQPGGAEKPTFETLISDGWVWASGDRVFVPWPLRNALHETDDPQLKPLAAALKAAPPDRVSFPASARYDAALGPLIAKLTTPEDLRAYVCPTPSWVAARLWEETRGGSDPRARLRGWLDRWRMLGRPDLVPRKVWRPSDLVEFWTAAVELLCAEPTLLDWDQTFAAFDRLMGLTHGRSAMAKPKPLPLTLVERAIWLDTRPQDELVFHAFAHDRLTSLARMLFADLAASDALGALGDLPARLLERTAQIPELFWGLVRSAEAEPTLLADMVLSPRLAAAGFRAIEHRRTNDQGFDGWINEQDNARGRREAIEDGAAMLAAHIDGGADPVELAVLLDSAHEAASDLRAVDHAEPVLTALRGVAAALPAPSQQAMIAALVRRLALDTPRANRLAAILELAAFGGVVDPPHAEAVVDFYVQAIGPEGIKPSVNRLDASNAATLVSLAVGSAELWARFNAFSDGKAAFAKMAEGEDNEFTVARRVAEALRAHIRVLARAVQGAGSPTPDLVDALVKTTRYAARADWPRGRVEGFSPEFERGVSLRADDRPLADDLAGALNRLSGASHRGLLDAILETEEPTILAELLTQVSVASRPDIERRLRALKPDAAAPISFLTSAQARVQALLAAGLVDVAADYIDEERRLAPGRNIPGRALEAFKAQLRLAALREDWPALWSAKPPADFNVVDKEAAEDSIRFHQGLAAFAEPDGAGLGKAEAIFEGLARRKRHMIPYRINLMAAQMSRLLVADLFTKLSGEDLRRAHAILRESETIKGSTSGERRNLAHNRALLLLAAGAPQRALEVLSQSDLGEPEANASAFRAVAFNRLDDGRQALVILDAAIARFGPVEVLVAARAHIQSGAPFDSLAATVQTDERMLSVKSAMTDLRALDPERQAGALGHDQGLDGLVIDHVAQVAASLINLAPEMRRLGMDLEDNISGLVRELLAARVQLLGWSAPDQSRGGRTGKANAGERDIVLRRDATELAVIEAVMCRKAPDTQTGRQDLAFHFQKLLAYSQCGLFVHLTYGLISEPERIGPVLEDIARTSAPPAFAFRDLQPLTLHGGPAGFVARYAQADREVKVVFIVVDLAQVQQIATAVHARAPKPAGA